MENPFDLKVHKQVERLQTQSYGSLEAAVASRRQAWVVENSSKVHPPISPRRAFELLFFDYMGLAAGELPVCEETEQKIVWQSLNACPTLAACQELQLDTRKVCRAIYEKSTQAFLSALDPQLRFLRSYDEIRPRAAYCKEWIVRVDFEALMAQAIEEARISRQEGNKGYGAVVVYGERVVGKAHDTAASEKDPSLHAEVNAIRQAARALGQADLSGALLISTCEPCPMCSSLAVWANLTTLVYGASIEETARLGKARIMVGAKEIVQRSPVMLEVIGGVLRDECLSLYQ